MKAIRNSIIATAAALLLMGIPATASAQYRTGANTEDGVRTSTETTGSNTATEAETTPRDTVSAAANPKATLDETWTLDECIAYARENNIDVRSKKASMENTEESLALAKSNRYPSLSFSTNQGLNVSNQSTVNSYMEASDNVSYTGSYNLSTSLTIFKGKSLSNTVKQRELQTKAAEQDIAQTAMDLEISVTKAYLQILYDQEALEINKKAEELSKYQVERGEAMYQAGSISKGDLAQLQSNHASDKYNVVTAEKALSVSKLTLKQLLELGLNDKIEIHFPEIEDGTVLRPIPDLADVYENALNGLPQMKSSELSLQASEKAISIAKGSYYPSISLTAGVSTGVLSSSNDSYFQQLSNKLGENVGLSIQVPIYSNRQVKTSVNQAKIQNTLTKLQDETYRKNLLSTIESLHNEATNAQSQFISASEQLEASQTSYDIINEQFSVGLKNSVDLITEENSYISAMSQKTQAKYRAILALKILNLYENC